MSKVRKKSPSKKAKKRITKTDREKLIEKHCDWINDKEFPKKFRNNFPEDIEEINKYIHALENAGKKYTTSFEVDEDKKLFQSYRYGYANGFTDGVTQVLERIKEVKTDIIDAALVNNK